MAPLPLPVLELPHPPRARAAAAESVTAATRPRFIFDLILLGLLRHARCVRDRPYPKSEKWYRPDSPLVHTILVKTAGRVRAGRWRAGGVAMSAGARSRSQRGPAGPSGHAVRRGRL